MTTIKTGITSEVLTIKSEIKIKEIFNKIINKKSQAVLTWIKKLNINKNSKIIIVGTYLTGIGIVKTLKQNNYNNIILIDIYPHLKDFINTNIGGESENIQFSTDLNLIQESDILIDTTGFGGLKPEFLENIQPEAFLIEDPIAEDNDYLLKEKNNIYSRLDKIKTNKKAILKTQGLNTKTSGTMTLTIKILTKTIDDALKKDGVLYSACEMRFYEDIIFKEKNIQKFLNLINKSSFKVSTIQEFNINELLLNNINLITSKVQDL